MKKFKSRKGFTLVELVVTVAILSIVVGLGMGTFVMTMQNYGTAASTEQEQEKAAQIENCITQLAYKVKDIKFIDKSQNAYKTYNIPTDEGTYFFSKGGSSTVEIYDYVTLEGESAPKKIPTISVSGVKKLKFSITRQKQKAAAAIPGTKENFLYLDYTIEMMNGYTLSGSMIMNGLEDTYPVAPGRATNPMVDDLDTYTVCEYQDYSGVTFSDKAILLVV